MDTSRRNRVPNLPTVGPGVTLLETDADLGLDPLHALVVDRLLSTPGDAHWVDAGGHARTVTLRELAPHRGYLDRVQVARGFTAYQHAALVDRLAGRLDGLHGGDGRCPHPEGRGGGQGQGSEEGRRGGQGRGSEEGRRGGQGRGSEEGRRGGQGREQEGERGPALVVAPAFDLPYREDDLPRERAVELLVRRLATLAGIAREHAVPVLLTRAGTDELAEPLANAADRTLRCEATSFGPRFTDDAGDTETLVYDAGDGYVQTTLAFWREVLAHRARLSDADGTPSRPAAPATVAMPGWE